MNAELEKKKEVRALYLTWLSEIDDQIAELEKPKPWEPKGGEWYISIIGAALDDCTDPLTASFGMERGTKEQAEQAAVAMRRFNRLLAYRDEFAPGYIFQYGGLNHYIFAQDRLWCVGSTSLNNIPANVYFPENVADELCRKLNSGEVIL
jgi:hypothetical protein